MNETARLYHTAQVLQNRIDIGREKERVLLDLTVSLQDRVRDLEALLIEASCTDNELVLTEVHLNPAGVLPPVHCPLLILVDQRLLHAERTGYITGKDRTMEYRLQDGSLTSGRYEWTYP